MSEIEIMNFEQICFGEYKKDSSLLFKGKSSLMVVYDNDRAHEFVQLEVLISVGSMNNSYDQVGIVVDNKFSNCNYYLDYFLSSPKNVTNMNQLIDLLVEKINFSRMPEYSILSVEKLIRKIDYQREDHMKELLIFFEEDKKKIQIVLDGIMRTKKKLEKITKHMQGEINHREQTLQLMLDIRGGSIEAYENIISLCNKKK